MVALRRGLRRWVLYPLIFLVVALLVAVVAGYAFYRLTLHKAGPAQSGRLALTGGTVLLGPELNPVANATVIIENGVIVAVGPDVEIPPDAERRDVSGRTVLPGLIDSHVHLSSPERERGEEIGFWDMPGVVADWVRYYPGKRQDFLRHGVTTVRSMGDENAWVHDFRRKIAQGELEGPRLLIAGPMFTTPGGHPIATFGVERNSDAVRVPSSPEEAREMVRALVTGDDPVDLIKVIQERGNPERKVLEPIRPDILAAIIDEAHRHHTKVFAHWGTREDLADLVAAGIDGLDHLEPRGVRDGWPDGYPETLVQQGITLAPTLAVTDPGFDEDTRRAIYERLREFRDAGGRVIAGSDAGMPGVHAGGGLLREIELLVAAGLTPHEAITAATVTPAAALRADTIGVIEPGRAADLLIVRGDPLTDIGALRDVDTVLRDGRSVVAND
ncbi:amidohydrolase family protein [Nocardia otitidiscaviarum]|uniref:amidohydrolase family protein n=1 Tax=Nocardia otitidiscaviarum TaxID=1823 RepID=UPI001894A66C|nr:amidohydrolase family protein [Nocardia otitidiscaviarum]MBF6181989.1 amidohydrolase family protein [Nocardia otitidiscaviarum]